ncbi:hypothetical protein [Nitrolancea hollandica]|uniref:Uncharacterized protein n=1 Tax=Nitrolancea hollandica Lb TaxID=1129897 RepID=I4EG62_9BACT|nr:hypothetical protein [Nitrolancea hollandica]CCF83674.1 hypothetical protein NITHO_2560008 [Nitrolancea hollandica Lb]
MRFWARAGEFLHRRQDASRWSGLLELEEARSAAERRLLLIREFSHLASDALNANPGSRRSWPAVERIAALHTAATMLLSCAADPTCSLMHGTEQDELPANEDLVTGIQTLATYLALQQALKQAPVLDPEPMRLLAREHARLSMFLDKTTEWLRDS